MPSPTIAKNTSARNRQPTTSSIIMPKTAQPPKKKKTFQPKINAFEADSGQLNEVPNTKYKGKRILLEAKYLYGRRIPQGEEELLFQCHIASVNDDNKTVFTNYPDTTGLDGSIDNYDLATFKVVKLTLKIRFWLNLTLSNCDTLTLTLANFDIS